MAAASLRIEAASFNIATASFGIATASFGIATASFGIEATSLDIAAASLDIATASLGIEATSFGIEATSLDIAAASLDIATASLGIEATSLGIAAASFGIATVSLRTATGSFGIATASFRIATASLRVEAASFRIEAASFRIATASLRIEAASFDIATAFVDNEMARLLRTGTTRASCRVAASTSARFLPSKSKEHLDQLPKTIHSVKTRLDIKRDAVESFGCKKDIAGPMDIDDFPRTLRKGMVKFVESNSLRPLHDAASREIENERSPTIYDKMIGIYDTRIVKSTDYVLNQHTHWPPSYVNFTVTSDGYVPGALLFFYLLPLQLRAALIAGVATHGVANSAHDEWTLETIGKIALDLDENDRPIVEAFVDNRVLLMNGHIQRLVEKRLAVLEHEVRLKSDA